MYRDKYFRDWTGPFPFTIPSVVQNAPAASGVEFAAYADSWKTK